MLEINKQHLEEEISSLEKGYVQSLITLIKVPVFNKRIDEDIKKEKDAKKIRQLEDAKDLNLIQSKGHQESIINTEEILKEVYKLRKKKFWNIF